MYSQIASVRMKGETHADKQLKIRWTEIKRCGEQTCVLCV